MNIAPQDATTAQQAEQGTAGDLRLGRQRTPGGQGAPAAPGAPVLRHRRDGILPATAAALSVSGTTLTSTGSKADQPPELHPLVRGFLDALPTERRERYTGRCPEAVLLSRFLTTAEAARAGRKVGRRQLNDGDARKALKQARLTARRIREDGDPEHGGYAPPCRSCTDLLDHFGVTAVGPGEEPGRQEAR